MPAPLDPVIAQIIPLLPLRDPKTMTPQSAREALRARSDASMSARAIADSGAIQNHSSGRAHGARSGRTRTSAATAASFGWRFRSGFVRCLEKFPPNFHPAPATRGPPRQSERSEERRVGKEC